MTSLALQFEQTGPPAEVVKAVTRDLPAPGHKEVRVAMRYAPINPADINYIQGNYGRTATLPAVPGMEGCGEVIELGDGVESLKVGDLVIPLYGGGTWAQHIHGLEGHFAKLPPGIDPVQASMLRINPLTALRLIEGFVDLSPGDWILQNAANSGVGRALIQIARERGLRTANLVRRESLFEELTSIGATSVCLDDENAVATLHELTHSQPARLASNAVGGDSALRLMDALAPHGTLVTYGAMGRKPLKVPNKFLIFKDLSLRGLWITQWIAKASHAELQDALQPLAALMLHGRLTFPIDEVFPLPRAAEALRRAQEDGRPGKVMLDLQAA